MTLRQQQSIFVLLVANLILHAYRQGYQLTFGEALRRAGRGIRNSLHLKGLAIDLNLFRDGKYLADSESHRELGAYWKTLHPLCRWGGDFKPKPDGNHYSMEWEGVK
jgi:hypothetical protein